MTCRQLVHWPGSACPDTGCCSCLPTAGPCLPAAENSAFKDNNAYVLGEDIYVADPSEQLPGAACSALQPPPRAAPCQRVVFVAATCPHGLAMLALLQPRIACRIPPQGAPHVLNPQSSRVHLFLLLCRLIPGLLCALPHRQLRKRVPVASGQEVSAGTGLPFQKNNGQSCCGAVAWHAAAASGAQACLCFVSLPQVHRAAATGVASSQAAQTAAPAVPAALATAAAQAAGAAAAAAAATSGGRRVASAVS